LSAVTANVAYFAMELTMQLEGALDTLTTHDITAVSPDQMIGLSRLSSDDMAHLIDTLAQIPAETPRRNACVVFIIYPDLSLEERIYSTLMCSWQSPGRASTTCNE
jgi:hypothetical protein